MNYQLDRHGKMMRLNNRPLSVEDAEQMAYVEQWNIDHPNSRIVDASVLFCFIIGIIVVTAFYTNREPVQPLQSAIHCQKCHTPDLTSYRKYTQYHLALRGEK